MEQHNGVVNPQLRIRIKLGLIQVLFGRGQISRIQRDELLRLQRMKQSV